MRDLIQAMIDAANDADQELDRIEIYEADHAEALYLNSTELTISEAFEEMVNEITDPYGFILPHKLK